ncbi:hypothetical protein BGZ75_008506 [Mortierella antarctica]|nr:hypothetical protein BGZ75_008506 [Mortierella antarctica]
MTPHAPNLFALSAGVRPSDPGTSAVYHSSSSSADAIDHTAAVMGDKKRGRPPEGATRARKKVASELMAFDSAASSSSSSTPRHARPTNMDISMNMDEGMVDGFRSSLSNSGKEAPKSVGTPEMHTSNVRTLNLRQRKWNSVQRVPQETQGPKLTPARCLMKRA